MTTPVVGTIREASCANCGGRRNCKIQAVFHEAGENGDGAYHWTVDWMIMQCQGCDYAFLLQESSDSEDIIYIPIEKGKDEIDYAIRSKYWPALSNRSKPDWISLAGVEGNVNEALDVVVLELYRALDSDLNVLAGMGARTCFDIASEVLGINPDLTFEKKLSQLVADGHIRESNRPNTGID